MTIRFSLRKRFRKLIVNSKGFSSVIGTTFMVLVMMFLGTSVFLWTLSQNTLYNEAVRARSQEEADRRNENIIATDGNYIVDEDEGEVTVVATLRNVGSVAAQIISLWVFDTTNQTYGFNNTIESLNLNLNPGDDRIVSAVVTIPWTGQNNTFNSWFVTARGNTVPLETEQAIIVAQVTQGIGSVSMDFTSFEYYNVSEVDGSYILDNYEIGGAEGYVVPADNHVAFEVWLTNYDQPGKREIKLFSGSILWAIFPVMGAQPRCAGWYIVNVYDDNGTIAPEYTTITLKYGVPTKVFFASKNDMESGGFIPSSASDWWQQNRGPAAVNLMLVGKIGSDTYGQNVPFVSIYFEP